MAYDRVSVEGKKELCGEIRLQGSKNAALPMLAATVVNKGVTRLDNCPDISDVNDMLMLLESIGCRIVREGKKVIVDAANISSHEIKEEHAKRTRGSFIVLGALLARCGCAKIPYPGGCRIGSRPIDIHLKALCKMGMEIIDESDAEIAAVFKKKAVHVRFSYPSVGATENVILASVLGEGTAVVISNVAREPEIVAFCGLLSAMGAVIHGAGTSKIVVNGVKELHDTDYKIPGDRIVAGTYMTAAMISRGSITIRGVSTNELKPEIAVFHKAGAHITMWDNTLHIHADKNGIKPVHRIVTGPYPGFATDMQSQIMSMLIYADGKSCIVENVFENRFLTVGELTKLGADICIRGNTAHISPAGHLYGADMCATDLRGGAALILAALGAIGKSNISGYRYVERGYEDFIDNLAMLGASVKAET